VAWPNWRPSGTRWSPWRSYARAVSPARTALGSRCTHGRPPVPAHAAPGPGRTLNVAQPADVLGRANDHHGAAARDAVIAEGSTPTRSVAEDLLLDLVEVDGAQFHSDRQATREDAERQALLEAHGYRVLRITCEQLTGNAAQTVVRIRQALYARGL
jgi:hypothetical protein